VPFLVGGLLIFFGLCQLASVVLVQQKTYRFTIPFIGIGLIIGGLRVLLNRN
jgi:hypothetical protein